MKTFDLQRFLKEKEYTQKELAELLSCAQPYISAILSGKKRFSEEKINLLKKKFGNIESYIIEVDEMPNFSKSNSSKYNQKEEVIISRDILDLLKMQSETILSQQRTIEKMTDKKMTVRKGGNAECADVSGSDLEK